MSRGNGYKTGGRGNPNKKKPTTNRKNYPDKEAGEDLRILLRNGKAGAQWCLQGVSHSKAAHRTGSEGPRRPEEDT